MIGVVAGAAGVIVACGCDDGLPHVGLAVIGLFLVLGFFFRVAMDKRQGCVSTSESDSMRRGGGRPKGVRPCNAG